ncbi:MAG: Gfo/Idh/MocA family oxidoreductase [Clostridia bacterium]|nr:Gfo/Idh/MocA family oxidoreductase [Clostridia bacterium]
MKDKVRIGVVGLGNRGFFSDDLYPGLIHVLAKMEDVELVAVCDEFPDRIEKTQKYMKEHYNIEVDGTTDYRELVVRPDIDAVTIFCAWEMHVPVAVAAMKAGKAVAMEVGGAYSIDDCWKLVRTQEETNAYFMFLENCCYNREELLALRLVREGLFGEIVHCDGAYCHDLRHEISYGEETRHYRLRNYLSRNCDNYPTHALGPICKILNVNNGNRMVALSSFASKAAGLNEYNRQMRGEDHKLAKVKFAQGDIVTTNIRLAGGETITLTLDTTLPRPYYSRNFNIRGTRGCYIENTQSIVVTGWEGAEEGTGSCLHNTAQFFAKYSHPIWDEYDSKGLNAGHGGMDWQVLRAFVEGYKQDLPSPIDVYDAAAWMCISALSEASIAMGGAVVDIPDFTCGRWIKLRPKVEWKYSL